MSEKSKIRRVPEYQRLGIEPSEGGTSRLHDENGFPILNIQEDRRNIPPAKELPNEPIAVKAKDMTKNRIQIASGSQTRGMPAHSSQEEVKPKILNVGSNDEHLWYSKEVTGVDEEVDTDALQGNDPLSASQDPEVIDIMEKYLDLQEKILNKLNSLSSKLDIENLKANLFAKSGIIDQMLKNIVKVSPANRKVVGEGVNDIIENIKNEFNAKLITNDKDDDEDLNLMQTEDMDSDKKENPYEFLNSTPNGNYVLFQDNDPLEEFESKESLIKKLENLLIDQNININTLFVLKKIPLDFGIIIKD
jgi:hypothetical protein